MWAPEDITFDEYVENLRSQIGTQYRNEWSRQMFSEKMPGPYHAFNTAAHPDNVRKFVDATGDLNPLFRDPAYGAQSPYGSTLAPPTFFYSVAYGHYPNPAGFAPSPKFQGMYAGDEYEWFDVIRDRDEFDWVTTMPIKVDVKQTRALGPVAFVHGQHEFFRKGTDELIARCHFWTAQRSTEGMFFTRPVPPEPVTHTPEYIAEVYAAQDAEIVRGAEPRYWEDVAVGEQLQPVVRGPFSTMDALGWVVGGMGERFFVSDRVGRYIHEGTGWSEWDERMSIHRNFHSHTVSEDALGAGAHRSSWMGVLLTNWAGDHGFITRMYSEHRAQGQFGNVYSVTGTVTGKREENGRFLVDIDCGITSHRGARNTLGSATIALPSRTGVLPVPVSVRA